MVRLLPFLILLGPAKGLTGLSPAPLSFESATREVDYEVDCNEYGELSAETVSSPAGAHSRAVGIDPATGWRQSVSHTITAAGQTFTASRSFTRAPLGRIGAIGFGADGEVDFQHHPRLRAVTGWDLRDDTGTPLLSRRQLLDGLDRLEHIVFSDGQGAEIGRLSYQRDEPSGRVARKTLLDGRFWTYGYDPDTGALTNAQLHAADGSPDPAHAHSYRYDAMGNRVERGGFTGVRTFGANADNQPTGPLRLEPELVSGWIEPVPGLSNLTIRVDGREAARSPGGGFHYLLDPPTNSAAHLRTVRITAHGVVDGQTSCVAAVEKELPQPGELAWATHNASGELTGDGLHSYDWDQRGRLRGAESLMVNDAYRLRFEYLDDGKLREYRVERPDGAGGWALERRHRYFYDGWNVLEERVTDAAGLTRHRHLWGPDLAGQAAGGAPAAEQGAGGVGGLLGTVTTRPDGSREFRVALLDHLGSKVGELGPDGQVRQLL